MKLNHFNKFTAFRTGKDIINLIAPKENSGTQQTIYPPVTETEVALYHIWKDVLGYSDFGIHDDFFKLGGNSLKCVQLVSRILRQFSSDIQLTDIYKQPTIAQIAALIPTRKNELASLTHIPLNSSNTHIPLSYNQERLWFINRLEGSVHYHIPLVFRLYGIVNQEALKHALHNIIQRHEVLRTVIREEDGKVYQHIQDADHWQLQIVDCTSFQKKATSIHSFIDHPFDLSNDYMLRAVLISLDEQENVLVITIHHIASDGWSIEIVIRELTELYTAYTEDRPARLQPLQLQYADYALHQRQQFTEEYLANKLSYWKEKLEGVVPLQLPTDFARPAVQGTRGAAHWFTIEKKLTERLQLLSQQQGTTLFMTLLAAFKVLLYRYSGQQDICVGSAIANRTREELENLIGFFVNTLALRSEVRGEASFIELLQQVRATTLDAYEHGDVPFEKVVEVAVKERDTSRSPLFQVMLVMQNTLEVPELKLKELILSKEIYTQHTTKFDLTFSITQIADGLQIEVEYSTDLFSAATINRMLGHFQQLLSSIVTDPQQRIGTLPLLTSEEEHQLLVEFNNTAVDYPRDKSIVHLFEEQVLRTPNNVAIVFEDEQLSYHELNARANQLAHYLRSKGVGEETLVPICTERSLEMIVGILGILKAGGAYVPIEADYPEERIKYMLEDTTATVVVSSKDSKEKLHSNDPIEVIELDTHWSVIARQPTTNVPSVVSPNHLAYVIYTSGSTGKPKGVMIEHRSLVDKLLTEARLLKADEYIITCHTTNYIFDPSILEIILPLLNGGQLIIPSDKVLYSAEDLIRLIQRHGVTVLQGAPGFIQHILSGLDTKDSYASLISLKMFCIGGESLPFSLVKEIKAVLPHIHINNHYGPTESTIDAIVLENLEEQHKNIIGKPITNAVIYITDGYQNLVPVGIVGEICIGGLVLARGYLNSLALTEEKFVADPFQPGSRIYKTGDLGRWTEDGKIEFIGRKDDQVKIRGNRVELGEIEAIISAHEAVEQAVVKLMGGEETSLQAFIVPKVKALEFWPSVGEYPIYDELLYFAMTHDKQRVLKYKEAINEMVRGKSVVDIGTGKDAVLARLCVEAGARIVYAIEIGKEAFEQAQALIHELGYKDKVKLIFGDATKVTIPEPVDVCVSEIIGTIGGSEGAAVILNNAHRFLGPGGQMIPERSVTCMAAVQIGDELYNTPCFSALGGYYVDKVFEKIGHPFNIRLCLKNVRKQQIISTHVVIEDLNFMQNSDEHYINEFSILVNQDSRLDGLLLWINLYTLGNHMIDSLEEDTSWLPVYFPLFYPGIEVLNGDIIQGKFIVTLSENDINPDYKIVGEVIHKNGSRNQFDFNSFYQPKDSDTHPFYDKLFYHHVQGIRSRDNEELILQDLKTYLSSKVPAYMVPNNFCLLKELPLMPNGKIDKNALTSVKELTSSKSRAYVAPHSDWEKIVAGTWEELLQSDQISIHDNFFELGGHSLLAMRMVALIKKRLEVDLAIKDLFIYPTVTSLAGYLEKSHKAVLPSSFAVYERPTFIPLSFNQERLWFIDQLKGSVHYHMPLVLRLEGSVNIEALKYALQTIIQRHEILRTIIYHQDGEAYQKIKEINEWQLTIVDGAIYRYHPDTLRQQIDTLINEPFDLSSDYMLRAVLISLDEQEHVLVITIHHIASDGWSIEIVIRELTELYTAYKEDRPAQLQPLQLQYADYALHQRKQLTVEFLTKKLAYWKEKLEGVAPLQLPTDFARPAVQGTKGATTYFSINKEVSNGLQHLSQQQGTTLFMTLLAAFKVLLYRYSGQQDICVGTSVADRQQQELENLIGFFVNTLALRSEVRGEASFIELLQQVRATTLEAYEHGDVPFEKVVEVAVKERDTSRSPLFQTMLVYENTAPVKEIDLGSVKLYQEQVGLNSTKFDLTFFIIQSKEGLQGAVEYSTELFSATTINRMLGHFQQLLSSIVADPQQRIGSLPLLTSPEEEQLLHQFNNTAVDYPRDKSIVHLFEEQVLRTPDNVAVVFEDEQLTYHELNARANQLAHYLQSKGVEAETLVPICIERSLEMIIGILGILKAGGAYVPIDPDYPQERITYMLKDTDAKVVVSSMGVSVKLKATDEFEVVELDTHWKEINNQPVNNPAIKPAPHHLAYVIYTSGSTGKPKGVMIEHRNVVRLFKTESPLYHFNEKDVWTMFHSFCFDFSVWEMYGALFYGGKLVIVPGNVTKDTALFSQLLLTEKVTILNQTPSAFYVLQDWLVDRVDAVPIRYVIFGGEALNLTKLRPWKKTYRNCRLINMYGITETTVHVTYQEIEWCQIDEGRSIIGKPIPTLNSYILDSNKNIVPIGIAGELYIGGAGLARGYLNRPDLTREKFLPHPFSTDATERLYRTGDRGRWLEDGTIEYLGRLDDQVKIRGYRIEPGEIEGVLLQSGLVKEAVVVVHDQGSGDKQLVGYYVAGEEVDKSSLVSWLHARLPAYMVPALWVQLPRMPLTPNGKVDKKALPAPVQVLSGNYEAPASDTEKALAQIWQEVLHLEQVGLHDNFFELGGHSLLAKRMVSHIERSLLISIPIQVLFQFNTIRSMGKYIELQSDLHTEKKNSVGYKTVNI